MCGILFTNDPRVDRKTFRAALGLMAHRGPDAPGGYLQVGPLQFGHNRLKILDLDDRSNQPFSSCDGRLVIVYNGEIYNFRELASRFGIELQTTSDTELLLKLYAMLGADMLPLLNGMFSFVIADIVSGEFFVARDRLGVKPLYWRQSGDAHLFSSEIAPVLNVYPGRGVDLFGLRQYLKLRTLFNGRTLYEGVEVFPAGCCLEGGRLRRYWELPIDEQDPPQEEELRDLVESAVRYRMIADVQVGAYLSGGLDSTIVAGLAGRVHTWSVGMPQCNEFDWARLAAEKLDTEHHDVEINAEQYRAAFVEMVKKRGEPLSVPNEVLLLLLTRKVRELNTVILSGEGADELFFGYDRVFRWAASAQQWDLATFDRLYSYGPHDDLDVVEDAISPFYGRGVPLDVVAAFFQVAHLHGLLRRLDNATMLCGVEARTPFVDYRLVERLAGVSFEYRMAEGVVKAPLKRVFADIVPPEIIAREKVGFPVALAATVPPGLPGATPMARWLAWNLELLGLAESADEVMRGAR